MKKSILVLLFNLGVIYLNGQDFFMYVDGLKHFYEISPTKMLVKSSILDTMELKKEIHSSIAKKIKKIHQLNAELIMIDIQDVNREVILQLIEQWNSKQSITYTSPVLLNKTGKEIGGVTNQVLLRLKSVTDYPRLIENIKMYNIKTIHTSGLDERTYLLTIEKESAKNVMQIANELYETGLYDYSEPNLIQFLDLSSDDQYFSQQWALSNTCQNGGHAGIDINIVPAWAITTGSPNVRIAILDSGVDLDHPDLQANLLPGFDATGNGGTGDVLNEIAHGTACAGISGALGNNTIGIAGIAYGCRILPVSIATSTSNWTTTESQYIAAGINWARQNGASVISMSFGCIETDALNTSIFEAATMGRNNYGCILVAASGNSNSSSISYPARNEHVIAVGAISYCGERKSPTSCDGEYWWGSNYGIHLDIVAPGVKIYTTDIQGTVGYNSSSGVNGNYYSSFNGTSAATPHVAGVAALILSVNPSLLQSEVWNIIESTAQKIGGYNYQSTEGRPNGSWHEEVGYGLLDSYVAVMTAFPPPCTGTTNLINQTISIPTTISDCNIFIQNVNLINNSSLILDVQNVLTIAGPFEVQLGSSFEVK